MLIYWKHTVKNTEALVDTSKKDGLKMIAEEAEVCFVNRIQDKIVI
jgi:hypothetical protein